MKKITLILFLIFLLTPIFCQNNQDNEELSPDTIIYIEDGDTIRIATVGEVWTDMDNYEEETKVTHNAHYDGETFVVPMSPADQEALKTQESIPAESGLTTPQLDSRGYDMAKSYYQEWGLEHIFAAYVDAMASIAGDASTRQLHGHLYAGGYVFTKNIKALAFDINMANNANNPTASTSLKIFGATIFDSGDKKLYIKKSWSKEYSVTKRFMIGPIPVSVTGTIGGSLGFEAGITLTTDGFGIQGNVAPNLNTYGSCEAAVDIFIAKAGAGGTIVFIDNTLSIVAGVTYVPDVNKLTLFLVITDRLEALKGEIYIFAKIRKPWGGWKEYRMTLFKWNGFQKGVTEPWILYSANKTYDL